jgi:plasmid stability protein
MATLTIRRVPEAIVARLKAVAARHGRSMEEELRDLLVQRYTQREALLQDIRDRWPALPPSSGDEIDAWIETGRQ